MKSIIKKTISSELGFENYIILLMNKIGFKEVDRYVTGGQMSSEKVVITFEGFDSDYKENDYIKMPVGVNGYFNFYSLREPNGYHTNTVEKFKEVHYKSASNIEICSFES